jgi:hypothetical protein
LASNRLFAFVDLTSTPKNTVGIPCLFGCPASQTGNKRAGGGILKFELDWRLCCEALLCYTLECKNMAWTIEGLGQRHSLMAQKHVPQLKAMVPTARLAAICPPLQTKGLVHTHAPLAYKM